MIFILFQFPGLSSFRLVSVNGDLLLDDLPDAQPEDQSFTLTKRLEKVIMITFWNYRGLSIMHGDKLDLYKQLNPTPMDFFCCR